MTDISSYGTHPEYLPAFIKDARGDDGNQVARLDAAGNRELAAATLSRFPAAAGDVIDFRSTPYEERLWWDDEEDWTKVAADLLSPDGVHFTQPGYEKLAATLVRELMARHTATRTNRALYWVI